jgi:transposase InsO family protein
MKKRRSREELREIIEKIEERGLTYKKGAEEYGVKVKQLYDHKYRTQKKEGKSQQEVKTDIEADGGSLNKVSLPDEIKGLITGYRKENPDHGFKRIEEWLKKKYLVVVQRKKIREVLKEQGLLGLGDSSFDKPKEPPKGSRRFEAGFPRELYQMDVTYVYIEGIRVLYLISVVDDYSRFCVSSILCKDQQGNTLIEVLHNACCRYGKPDKLLTDQGRGFYSWSLERTRFQGYLEEMGIEHIVSDPHSPETQGKIERFHQTIKNELVSKVRFKNFEDASRRIAEYIMYYNYERPHQGIAGANPSDRFHGVIGETSRLEAELVSKQVDLSRGYLIFKAQEHTISVASSGAGLQIFLDGKLLS